MLLTLASAVGGSKSADVASSKSPSQASRGFYTEEARILDQPYHGTLAPVFTNCANFGRRAAPIVLNYMLPPEGAKGSSPDGVSFLASTKDGTEYWDKHAYRSELPTQEELAALSTFEEFVAVLGPPTDHPSDGRTEGDWGYDTVVWRLFTPVDETNISVIHVTLHRKWNTTGAIPVYTIDCFGIRGGGLEGGGAGPLFPLPGQPGSIGPIVESPVVSPS